VELARTQGFPADGPHRGHDLRARRKDGNGYDGVRPCITTRPIAMKLMGFVAA
jgi:hypothetical protein